jgi:Uma2 family endonuclease
LALKCLILKLDGGNSGVGEYMVGWDRVSASTHISAEQYLHMTFEHDAELVRGEIVERSMPDNVHSLIQYLILMRLGTLAAKCSLHPRPELRLKIASDTFRVPDVCVFTSAPTDRVPDKAPLVVIEILSKDDRHVDVMQKLEEFHVWGVPYIWLVDPITKRLFTYSEQGFRSVSSLVLAEYPFQLTPADLFSELV